LERDFADRKGLQTALDITVVPGAALHALREAPTWGWAFLISALVAMAATFALTPALDRAIQRQLPAQLAASPQMAQLPAEQRDALITQQTQFMQAAARFSFVFIPFGLAIGCALQAAVMLAANTIGNGDGSFKKFWALAVNAAVVGTGIAAFALLAIVLLRGTDGFASPAEIANALPGLGTFVPPEAKAAAAFFGALNVFAIWDAVLLAAGMRIVARLPRKTAIGAAAVILLGTGLVPLAGVLIPK